MLQRARWALDEQELRALQERAEYYGLDKADSFAEYRAKYLEATDRSMSNGMRTSRFHTLTQAEIADIISEAESIEIPIDVLKFNEGYRTGYSDKNRCINVRGDVLPDLTSTQNRDTISARAVLAHEYYGHYKNSPSEYSVDDWRDEYRASRDAAINTPNLSVQERASLMIDAYERAREAGEFLDYDEEAKRIIYGRND